MRTVDIIAKKRDGHALTREEIDFFIQGFTKGDIPDYQAAAWAMAVYLRGMNEEETTALTLAMAASGEILDLSTIAPRVLDKHSSGGVGDKTTIVVAPLVASLGLPVGKMSGRGLGFSGGTLDKLEAIPGFRVDLDMDEFLTQLEQHGIVVSGQTHDLAPADGKLYALRDVTATVSCIPLIASSIMSKKIASGTQLIVLDVKVGRGAFMKTQASAIELAELMVKIGRLAGRRVAAIIGNMDQPLGNAVGNSLEVIEAIETLKGRGPADFAEHCLAIAAQMLLIADEAQSEQDALAKLEAAISSGRALKKFGDWIQAQGAEEHLVDDYSITPRAKMVEDDDYSILPHAKIVEEIVSPQEGYIAGINAEEVGLTVVDLGGGRAKKGDTIDHAVGVVLRHKVGERVKRGEPLLVLHANDRPKFNVAKERLLAAYEFSATAPETIPLIHKVIR